MKTIRLLLTLYALFSLGAVAAAATLQAKVTEVQSGNTLVAGNINRTLKVRLKGIAPPQAGQPFSDAAREHLKALVLNQPVKVEYTNLSAGYLDAKIVLNGIDIGSQMLRDGVAWYDRRDDYALTVADRELYARCEQAARDEKRGLWSDPAAVAPWEFLKAKQTAAAATVPAPVSFSAYRASAKSAASSGKTLSNRYLGRGNVEPGAIAGSPNVKQLAPNAAPGDWISYESETPRFSIRVPGNSYFYEYPILDGDLKIVNMNYLVGTSDGGLYTVMWTKGANDMASDTIIADGTIDGFVKGLNRYFETKRLGISASYSSGRAVRLGGYAGKQYSISAGVMSGFARVVSRQIGGQREIFAVAVFTPPGDDSGLDFLNSMKLSQR